MQLKNINIPQVSACEPIEKMSLDDFISMAMVGDGEGSLGDQIVAGNDHQSSTTYKPVPPPKPISPPYRMPPQPPGGSSIYGEAPIPGAAPSEMSTSNTHATLMTHSSKFPIERELILSSDKGATKIPLMSECRTPSGIRRGPQLQLLHRTAGGAIAPDHPPKQMQAWNSQSQAQSQQEVGGQQPSLTGAIPRTPARLPEDVTALAERENNKDLNNTNNKNAVTKTYHTLKDLISSKFKKDSNDAGDELNNVTIYQQNVKPELEDYRSPYSALPVHMRHMQGLNQSQPNIWNGGQMADNSRAATMNGQSNASGNYYGAQDGTVLQRGGVQQRAISQPQLNMPFERRGSQVLLDQPQHDRRGSLANIEVTDSDDGGFASRTRRPQTVYQMPPQLPPQPPPHTSMSQRNSPHVFNGATVQQQHQYNQGGYQGNHMQGYNPAGYHQPGGQMQQVHPQMHNVPQGGGPNGDIMFQGQNMEAMKTLETSMNQTSVMIQARQDTLRASFQKSLQEQNLQIQAAQQAAAAAAVAGKCVPPPRPEKHRLMQPSTIPDTASSDYDKSGNHSSNVDSGRGSAAYSSGRKAALDTSPEHSDSPAREAKNDDSEWVDIVDAELRHILEPGMQGMSLRPESTVSGSVSSVTPPLPPLSPSEPQFKSSKQHHQKETGNGKQEYGMDSYNRPSKSTGPIGPSRAGWPGNSVQKQAQQNHRSSGKKHEQSLLKRHLFGLDNDLTSTTTRSLDLESLLGGPWGAGQSVSDSETDTQGLRHIKTQLEGLENMYSEVLRMLGSRVPPNARMHETPLRNAARRRHGSLSSLPSSSVSGRPIRDRRRAGERSKVRDVKGVNKRFQRLESHVVTLARSVAHLSSEMRSQHLVTQELERLRDDLTMLRSQSSRAQNLYKSITADPEPPNLTNPRRVKKLTKFFGEDPPLMRLFLKQLGYEKYAALFEAERVGMVELPYLGEERLQKLGVPLGPRLRILQEAQISLCKDTTLCIV